jgi:hypothetical protein
MLMNLPLRPRSRKTTMPGTFAKSVSSLPRPTFSPGFETRAALPHQDGAARYQFPAESFHA